MKPAGDQEFGVTVKLAVILGMSGWDEMVPGDIRQPEGPCIFAQRTSTSGFPVCSV